ncbi:MAG: formamidopyrimidine-DNA glycosylase [Planctomycetes bacterium]|nr:formamidopyrimidine-DNA glycosylase [Planctomycetota bacterium]
MPELPDVANYVEALEGFTLGRELRVFELSNPFVLRTVEPGPNDLVGRRVEGYRRFGKRIVFAFEDELFLVLHLMIAGRLRWRALDAKGPGGPKRTLANLTFDDGRLWLTEVSSRKRASLHVVRGEDALEPFRRAGLEVLDADFDSFRAALTAQNRTLKRAMTDPRILSGIGNAYSDEILFHARLSPVVLTSRLSDAELLRLFEATRTTLTVWTDRLRAEVGDGFPEKVTAFHPEMAVHGRYREPCRACGKPIQRIRYANNECNYCAECQNAGRLLADRGLSQLMRKDWPKTLEELEELRGGD